MPDRTTVEDLLRRYLIGERNFERVHLRGAAFDADFPSWMRRRERLPGVNLSGANFSGADLSRARLSAVDLSGASLSGADLAEADLADADLSNADFSNANLSDVNLKRARLLGSSLSGAKLLRAKLQQVNLTGTDLSGANLDSANLSNADLFRANLSHADLAAANLDSANLHSSNLAHANLFNANLSGANLHDADLTRTNFEEALFSRTTCSFLQLRNARGLDTVNHGSPSALDTHTLQLSWGRLPRSFLVGCGLADWQIETVRLYDPALRRDERETILYEIYRLQEGAPIVFHSVFISYSTADEEFCAKLHADLQAAGVRCWFAPHDVVGGKKLHEQIDRAIHQQDRLLLVLSEASMSSAWVKTEIANARQKEREQNRAVLFPIRLVSFDEIRRWKLFDADAGTDTGREVREYYIPDFSEWRDASKYRPEFERLVQRPSSCRRCASKVAISGVGVSSSASNIDCARPRLCAVGPSGAVPLRPAEPPR